MLQHCYSRLNYNPTRLADDWLIDKETMDRPTDRVVLNMKYVVSRLAGVISTTPLSTHPSAHMHEVWNASVHPFFFGKSKNQELK